MARPWSEVVADPNFQALAPDAKENARNAYFQQNVLPNIPEGANASAIRLKFDQDTVPTLVKAMPQTIYDAAEFKRRVGRDPENSYELAQFAARKGVGFAGDPTQGRFTAAQAAGGALEDAVALGTGAVAAVPAAATYIGSGGNLEAAKKVQSALTYSPHSDAGQAGIQGIGQIVSGPGKVVQFAADKIDPTGNLSATLGDLGERSMVASGILPGVAALRGGLAAGAAGAVRRASAAVADSIRDPEARAASAQEVLNNTVATSPQSQGAAAAALQVNSASPELQRAIVRAAQKNGGAVNAEATLRQLEAGSLPVPVDLTEGQATRNAALYSEEQNLRGKLVAVGEHLGDQNTKLGQNVQAIRDQVGPDVFTTNNVEHGDTLMGAYEDIDKAANDQINAAYQKARDMVPDKNASVMSAPELMSNVIKALHEHDLFDSAPKDIMATLNRRAENGSMTFANIENMKTNLARIQRSFSADGNTRYAAGIIRDQLEQMPLTVDNAQVQAAYNAARSLARQRFQAIDADPAYKAVVNEKIAPDDFVRKFVINGKRDDVSTMAQAMQGNDKARQTIAVAVLDHLRDKAGLGSDYRGLFKQAGYNNALMALDPKLQSLVGPRTAETLQNLGQVAHNIQVGPPGHTVNSSNTLTAGLSDYAQGAAEHSVNKYFGGVPIGTLAKKGYQSIANGARIRQAIQPGAGIGRLANTSPEVEAMLEAARLKAAAAQQVNP